MKQIMILCQNTGQTAAFKRTILAYTDKLNFKINWIFKNHITYDEYMRNDKIDLVLFTPEVLIYEKKIMEHLNSHGVKFIQLEPMDYGLRRVDNIMKNLEIFL